MKGIVNTPCGSTLHDARRLVDEDGHGRRLVEAEAEGLRVEQRQHRRRVSIVTGNGDLHVAERVGDGDDDDDSGRRGAARRWRFRPSRRCAGRGRAAPGRASRRRRPPARRRLRTGTFWVSVYDSVRRVGHPVAIRRDRSCWRPARPVSVRSTITSALFVTRLPPAAAVTVEPVAPVGKRGEHPR